jgi:hypothetical protein
MIMSWKRDEEMKFWTMFIYNSCIRLERLTKTILRLWISSLGQKWNCSGYNYIMQYATKGNNYKNYSLASNSNLN